MKLNELKKRMFTTKRITALKKMILNKLICLKEMNKLTQIYSNIHEVGRDIFSEKLNDNVKKTQ